METLGDILAATLQKGNPKMFYDVTLRHERMNEMRKITDIKALREMTRPPAKVGEVSMAMSLASAKAAIESLYEKGSIVIRLTPEQYGAWAYNARWNMEPALSEMDWWIDDTKPVFPEPATAFFTV